MNTYPIPASQPGALAGFEAICPTCGMALRNTMESSLQMDAQAHAEWHERTGR